MSVEKFDYKAQDINFWKKHLKGLTLQVCRYSATERPALGTYDKFYKSGTYYCACCGGDYALFNSDTKYDSGSGWPSFYEPIRNSIIQKPDLINATDSLIDNSRTEVICLRCESHLGHVFDDGPQPTGKRYCINPIALTFVAKGQLPKRLFNIEV